MKMLLNYLLEINVIWKVLGLLPLKRERNSLIS
jgi:hypothetical protein